jgi:hypothetical protein
MQSHQLNIEGSPHRDQPQAVLAAAREFVAGLAVDARHVIQ